MPLSSDIQVRVTAAGYALVNGVYNQKDATQIPAGFDRTCQTNNWDAEQTWRHLSDERMPWFESDNESYIYWNKGDGKWWIDAPSGAGVYIVKNNASYPPRSGWEALCSNCGPVPTVEILGR